MGNRSQQLVGKLAALKETNVAWKLVEKTELLGNKDVTLNAERYMGGEDAEHDHEIVTVGEICLDVQSGYSCSASKQSATGVPHRLISDWEQGRKKPSAAARAFLLLVDEFGAKALKRLARRAAA